MSNPIKRQLHDSLLLPAVLTTVASIYGLSAVVLAAMGNHVFGFTPGTPAYGLFTNALMFQFLHAVVILWLAVQLKQPDFWLKSAALSFSLGILLFCGGIYLLLLLGKTPLSIITPIGGSLLILGWLNLTVYGFRYLRRG
jgi:uncharacterized membrane protein YgdD (TMEM256/DUF423 family)